MKADVFILGLFTFKDEDEINIVFNNEELHQINNNIQSVLETEGLKHENSKWVTYDLRNQKELSNLNFPGINFVESTMGYYHHRVIFQFKLEGPNLHTELRSIRENIKQFIQAKIEKAIITPNKLMGFERCDIYPLFIMHEGINFSFKKENPVFSNDTTTMTFDITEPNALLPVGKKYNIRISIPSTIIYTKNGVSNDFLKAMINAIYQYCLYEKKDVTKKGIKVNTDIGEDQLVNLWKYIIDTMGGRTLDKNISKISQTNYFVAFAAFVVALIAFDLEKLLQNVMYLRSLVKVFINFIL